MEEDDDDEDTALLQTPAMNKATIVITPVDTVSIVLFFIKFNICFY